MDTVNHINLRVERSAVSSVLTALLSAIFFQRNLDGVEPYTLDILDTHVAVVAASGHDDTRAVPAANSVERDISSKVDEFVRTIVDTDADSGEVGGGGRHAYSCQIAVVFLQRKNKKGWFAVTEVGRSRGLRSSSDSRHWSLGRSTSSPSHSSHEQRSTPCPVRCCRSSHSAPSAKTTSLLSWAHPYVCTVSSLTEGPNSLAPSDHLATAARGAFRAIITAARSCPSHFPSTRPINDHNYSNSNG